MVNILVTGSSSGFGYLTALALAKRNHTVFATMRDPEGKNRAAAADLRRLAEAQRLAIRVLDLDVTSDAAVQAAVDAAIAQAGPLDVVVNNAGYMVAGLAETATAQQMLDELNTNVVGIQRVNRAALPGMRARRGGLLIHVSSIFGRTVLPFLGSYTVTKWAVEALAETYRYELKPSGVDVAIVEPGPFPTSLYDNIQLGADAERAAGYGPLANGLERLNEGIVRSMFALPNAPDPHEVADAIVALVEAPAGKRPARVVVDRFSGDDARTVNDAYAPVQRAVLAGIGLPFLAE
jgi:NAD(P)-dependent dehydrogenase (short-subunit alcohol dehydrogenase family)